MRVFIYWPEILHYHAARLEALFQLMDSRKDHLTAVAIRSWSPDFPDIQYQSRLADRVITLSDVKQAGMQSGESAKQLLEILNQTKPDCVAVLGYDTRVSRRALGWCLSKGRSSILLSESQAIDYPRHTGKETFKKYLVGLFDAAFVSGSSQREYLCSLGMDERWIITGYSAVDNQFWSEWRSRAETQPEHWREVYHLPVKYFLTVCRLVSKKNISGLLSAYSNYLRSTTIDPWDLVIAGDGPLMSELRDEALQQGMAERVHFLGNLTADELGPVYGLASVFVLASNISEQWGLVVNEAMAAGLPVLVSAICGCSRDLVIKGETGFSFNPGNIDELANLMILMSSGDVDLGKLGNNARKHIELFSTDKFAENLLVAVEIARQREKSRRNRVASKLIGNLLIRL